MKQILNYLLLKEIFLQKNANGQSALNLLIKKNPVK